MKAREDYVSNYKTALDKALFCSDEKYWTEPETVSASVRPRMVHVFDESGYGTEDINLLSTDMITEDTVFV